MNLKLKNSKNTLELKTDIQNCNSNEMEPIIKNKIIKIQDVIQCTISSIQLYKTYHIYSNSDVMYCLTELNDIYIKSTLLYNTTTTNIEDSINKLQIIVDKLSIIISNYGTTHLDDLLFIIFGSDFLNQIKTGIHKNKYELIRRFVHPINYKSIQWKQNNKQSACERNTEPYILCKNKMDSEPQNIIIAPNMEGFDVEQTIQIYAIKVNGIQLVIHNEKMQKTIIIQCICEDISFDCITNKYIDDRLSELYDSVLEPDQDIMKRIIETLTIKDILIYGNADIYKRIILVDIDIQLILNNKIENIIKKFGEMDLFSKRALLINYISIIRFDYEYKHPNRLARTNHFIQQFSTKYQELF